MNINFSIKLKAGILCIVLAPNTLLNFACAVGIDVALIKRAIHHLGMFEATRSSLSLYAVDKKHHNNAPEDIRVAIQSFQI